MRKREVIPTDDWRNIVADLDGDDQLILNEWLEGEEEKPFVEFRPNRLGRIDSESSPCYVDSDEED